MPLFNGGDHAGCATLYRRAAAELLSLQLVTGKPERMLRKAVAQATRGDATKNAWALRHALDAAAAAGLPDDCSSHKDGAIASVPRGEGSSSRQLTVADTIHAAIDIGVPAFNAGDHELCARIYADAASTLTTAEISEAAKERLVAASQTHGDSTKRAWALRHALDSCLKTEGRRMLRAGSQEVVLAQPVHEAVSADVVVASPVDASVLPSPGPALAPAMESRCRLFSKTPMSKSSFCFCSGCC